METKPYISVIVPIYNVEQYLDQCVLSIVNQEYKELEIILVDDGSPDACPQICDKWAAADKRIKVIHKDNSGLSSARNAGLDICTGKYVSFIDSDDWLETNMYSKLIKHIEETNSDVAICQINNIIDGKPVPSCSDGLEFEINSYNDLLEHILPSSPQPVIMFQVWNKLYSREAIGDYRFKVGQRYEDIYFQRNVLQNVKKAVCFNSPLYNYRVARPGSTVSSFNSNRLSKIDELDSYIDYLESERLTELACRYIQYSMDSIMELYLMAKRYNGDLETRNKLIEHFSSKFHGLKVYNVQIRPKYLIFKYSPLLYYIVSQLLSKIR